MNKDTQVLMKSLYRVWDYPFALPEVNIGPHYHVKNLGGRSFLHYQVKTPHDGSLRPFYVQTNTVSLPMGPYKSENGALSFGISREDCPKLFDLVGAVESQAEHYLRTVEIPSLPEARRKQFQEAKGPLVRPLLDKNYFRLFFNPSYDCVTYDWTGREVYQGEMKSGNYQFILRLSCIYLGQDFPCYLQWKIAQIRYFPIESDLTKPLPFFFHPVDDNDQCTNTSLGNWDPTDDFMSVDMADLLSPSPLPPPVNAMMKKRGPTPLEKTPQGKKAKSTARVAPLPQESSHV